MPLSHRAGSERPPPNRRFQNDKLHRTDGPALVLADGQEEWFRNGVLHRTDGPALVFANGQEEWFRNGKLHRSDGPAVVFANGQEKWYWYGEEVPAPAWALGPKPTPEPGATT